VGGGGGGEGADPEPTHNNLFTSPDLRPEMALLIALFNNFEITLDGLRPGLLSRSNAEAPDTWGQAMEVPLRVEDPVSEL